MNNCTIELTERELRKIVEVLKLGIVEYIKNGEIDYFDELTEIIELYHKFVDKSES